MSNTPKHTASVGHSDLVEDERDQEAEAISLVLLHITKWLEPLGMPHVLAQVETARELLDRERGVTRKMH